MSEQLKQLASNPTVRRLVVAGIAAAVVALNKKLGLNLDAEAIGGLVALAVAYLLQSAAVDRARIIADAKAAGDEAAAKVVTVEDAAKVLSPPETKP